jgi:rhomboid protease GluP
MGRANLLTVFVVSVLAGGLLSMGLSPARPSLGASGGDFGLIAASVVFGWKYEDQLPAFARKYFGWAILPYLVYPLCLGLLSSSVDNWGHLGGMFGGGLAATWLRPDGFAANAAHNKRARQGLLAAGLLAMFCVALWGPKLVQVLPYRAQGLETAVPQSWEEGWDFGDDRGWVSPTGQATWVATTRQLASPPTPEQALQRFQQQLESRVSAVHVAARDASTVQGWPALRATLTYRRGGVLQQMELLLVCRGATVHRMHLHFEERSRFRYTQLAERLFSTVSLSDPPLLLDARSRVAANPNSWKLAVELGRQAALTGHPLEAAEALANAYQMPRADRPRVAALRLDLYGDYGLGLDPSHIDLFLQEHGEEPQVVVAAAQALERSGDPAGALAILEDAAQQSPDDLLIQRALAQRRPTPRSD